MRLPTPLCAPHPGLLCGWDLTPVFPQDVNHLRAEPQDDLISLQDSGKAQSLTAWLEGRTLRPRHRNVTTAANSEHPAKATQVKTVEYRQMQLREPGHGAWARHHHSAAHPSSMSDTAWFLAHPKEPLSTVGWSPESPSRWPQIIPHPTGPKQPHHQLLPK